jgi:uncharacterized protein YxjI
MREKLLSIGDDFWLENDQSERTYKADPPTAPGISGCE